MALLRPGEARFGLAIVVPRRKVGLVEVGLSHLFFESYRKIFVRPRALKTKAIAELFPDVPRIDCQTASRKGPFEDFGDEDVARIHGYDLDFVLAFGDWVPRGNVLTSARFGVWSFLHGSVDHYQGRPRCFWQIYYREPATGAVLRRISDHANSGVVLRKGYFRTQNSSYAKNLQLALSESSRWPAQVCRDILNNNAGYMAGTAAKNETRELKLPTNGEILLFLARMLATRIESVYWLFFRYSFWNIGLVKAPIERFLDHNYKPKIDWLPRPPNGEFKADPFGALAFPNVHVFYENLDYHRPKGIIYTVDLTNGTFASQPKKMIELPVHMSYPYLVEHEGEVYCVPETNHAGEICVYKATRFPYEWVRKGTLLRNVAAIDTTIFQHEGTWWMMFTDRRRGGDANLFAWYAPDFWGPWKPHMNNPVKSDVRSARPGGTPFYHEGSLYRPAQDCSRTGGGRIVINRIRRLSPSEFEEDEEVASVEPDKAGPYPEGLHTLSKVGDFTLVDGKRFEFTAYGLLNKIVKGIRRTLDQE